MKVEIEADARLGFGRRELTSRAFVDEATAGDRPPLKFRQAAFFTQSAHQPVGAISPSTILQPLGASKKLQPSH